MCFLLGRMQERNSCRIPLLKWTLFLKWAPLLRWALLLQWMHLFLKCLKLQRINQKENGFVSSTFGVVTPNLDQFIFAISTSYGEVIGKTDIADAGTFEATTSITGAFAGGSSIVLISGATEIKLHEE